MNELAPASEAILYYSALLFLYLPANLLMAFSFLGFQRIATLSIFYGTCGWLIPVPVVYWFTSYVETHEAVTVGTLFGFMMTCAITVFFANSAYEAEE